MDEQARLVAERVGRTIRALRAEKGIGQAELANRIGFTSSGLWKVEVGRTDVPLSTLVKIANELDTPLERVVAGPLSDQDIREKVDLIIRLVTSRGEAIPEGVPGASSIGLWTGEREGGERP